MLIRSFIVRFLDLYAKIYHGKSEVLAIYLTAIFFILAIIAGLTPWIKIGSILFLVPVLALLLLLISMSIYTRVAMSAVMKTYDLALGEGWLWVTGAKAITITELLNVNGINDNLCKRIEDFDLTDFQKQIGNKYFTMFNKHPFDPHGIYVNIMEVVIFYTRKQDLVALKLMLE